MNTQQMLDAIREMQCQLYSMQAELLKAQYQEDQLAKESSHEALLHRFVWASES